MYDDKMFKSVAELWKEYLTLASGRWPENDVRHDLGGEVRDRLRQIDRILRHLHEAIDAVAADPAENQKWMEHYLASWASLARGEITPEEFEQASALPARDAAVIIDSWDDVWIFTETFYFYAWRLVEVLNGSGQYKFPGLAKVKASAVKIVRNHLIQHPEKVKDSQNFTLGLVVMSSGPVLRSRSAVLRLDSGRVDPSPDSKDQGLFAAAEELREELERRFSAAIASVKP